jgi:dipeptidase
MASDLFVALAPSTRDGHTYFGHNCNRPRGDQTAVVREPGRDFAPGEHVALPDVRVPQARHTLTVLAGRRLGEWGYQHGVNEKGVAVGCTPIRTRLEADAPGLAGPDLVRLALERAATACQAVEVLTDLIGRHGQEAGSALLVADCQEACVLEAAGRHWAEAQVGSVRAVPGACLLRQDWDRISRGLADLAIERHWWTDDGKKLDFAGAVGQVCPDHAASMRRWGQATLCLEQQAGHLDEPLLRRLLCDQAEMVAAKNEATGELETVASFLVRLGPTRDDLAVCWYASGWPQASVYLPLFVVADLPAALTEESSPWRALARWQADGRHDARVRAALHSGLAGLQQRLDEHLHELLPEASSLHRQGRRDELRGLAGSFMQYGYERFEELAATLRATPAEGALHGELVEVW